MGSRTPNLPIAAMRGDIVAAVRENPVVIIEAETGAGKSTQVPQYLLEEGWNLVVTQPRRLAARSVAQRVAWEMSERVGESIGVRTRDDNVVGRDTRCLFVTDGLALVRELMGAGQHNVLVLDEVHEWNENLEVLVAWAKLQLGRGASFKLVLMSATMESAALSRHFDGAPVISVPGRMFPVSDQRPGRELEADVAELLKQGRNVLVFQPGKAEIAKTIATLKALPGLNAEILPLHGELTTEEQAKCFQHYGRPKCVVSTNVAQTSVTIDDIDAVVDSGMERRIELVDGVEGLYLKPISLADSKQRKGRAGRVKPGIYIDHCAASNRPEFPVAEILRKRLDQTVLRLAEAGFDAEELSFFHQPDRSEIHDAKRLLRALGCMDASGKVTAVGKAVNRMPVSVIYARMIVEADRLGVVDDVLTIAAILEVGEITARKDRNGLDVSHKWRALTDGEVESDLMAQLKVFQAASRMSKDEMYDNGVHSKAFFQARDVRRHLAESLRSKVRDFRSSGDRTAIIRAICAGMVDHLFRGDGWRYRNGDSVERELAKETVVRGGDWIVGLPFDLQVKTKRGGMMMLRLVRMVTKVDPSILAEVAPQLTELKTGLNPRFDASVDVVVSTTETHFNGTLIRSQTVADEACPTGAQIFAAWLASQIV